MKSAVSFVVIFLLSGLTSLIQPNPAAQTLDSKNSFFFFSHICCDFIRLVCGGSQFLSIFSHSNQHCSTQQPSVKSASRSSLASMYL